MTLRASRWYPELIAEWRKIMRNPGKSPLAATLLGLVLLAGLSACDTIPVTTYWSGYGIGYDDYYYYPTTRVYYQPYSGYYYYPSGDRWLKVRTLPTRYRIDDRYRVVIKDRHTHRGSRRRCRLHKS